MELKIHLKKIKGKWYASSGPKGYKVFLNFGDQLSEWLKKSEADVVFSQTKNENTVFLCKIRKEGNNYVIDFYDTNTQELVTSEEQCPKIFNDFSIDSEFYLNYKVDDSN